MTEYQILNEDHDSKAVTMHRPKDPIRGYLWENRIYKKNIVTKEELIKLEEETSYDKNGKIIKYMNERGQNFTVNFKEYVESSKCVITEYRQVDRDCVHTSLLDLFVYYSEDATLQDVMIAHKASEYKVIFKRCFDSSEYNNNRAAWGLLFEKTTDETEGVHEYDEQAEEYCPADEIFRKEEREKAKKMTIKEKVANFGLKFAGLTNEFLERSKEAAQELDEKLKKDSAEKCALFFKTMDETYPLGIEDVKKVIWRREEEGKQDLWNLVEFYLWFMDWAEKNRKNEEAWESLIGEKEMEETKWDEQTHIMWSYQITEKEVKHKKRKKCCDAFLLEKYDAFLKNQ